MEPSSRCAASSKPNVAYLDLNLSALLKKQTTFPPLVYAGIPYQVLGARSGALAVTMARSRSAMARSDCGISAIFASTSRSPASLSLLARASAFSSRARSFIAARSSAVNPLAFLPVAAVFLADLRESFFSAMAKHLLAPHEYSRVTSGAIAGRSAQLLDADQVPRGIAKGAVADPVRLIDRLLDDLGVAGLQPLEGAVEVGGGQVDAGVGALGHHLGDGAALVVGDSGVGGRRMEDDGCAGLVGGAHR